MVRVGLLASRQFEPNAVNPDRDALNATNPSRAEPAINA
jgi:hypothetical protein